MTKKKLSGGAQVSAVFASGRLPLVLFILSSNSVPEPWSGVVWLSELATMRNVLVLLVPITFPLTVQSLAVSPANWTGISWKLITDESKTRSPWNPTRLSARSILKVSTGKVKLLTKPGISDIGKATMIDRGVGLGTGSAVLRVTVVLVVPEGRVTVPS